MRIRPYVYGFITCLAPDLGTTTGVATTAVGWTTVLVVSTIVDTA